MPWHRLASGLVALALLSGCSASKQTQTYRCDHVVSVTTDAWGGKTYRFDDGAQQVVPKRGFDPATAPAIALEHYGIPTRPQGGSALREWTQDWGRPMDTPPGPPGYCTSNRRNS
ncbi:MAG: hypothetical protein QOI03_1536 [Solirubrobacteraceae bacterium]|jgi:hypothetical protein|nr:hypothetical protein [Solirubrobacteraceae bacterium]